MNDLTPIRRASRIADTFSVWRQTDGGKASRLVCDSAILPDVLREAASQSAHKDVLFILHTDGLTAEKTVHAYVMRQGKREWRVDRVTRVGKWDHPLKADPLFSLPVTHFAPIEPWRWTPTADPIGTNPSVLEMR